MNKSFKNFLCSECGSNIIKDNFYYKSKLGNDLYSSVLHEIQCGFCFMDIPGYIGKRLNNISDKNAKLEWINKYKPEHLKIAPKYSVCNLYFYQIEKKLDIDKKHNMNIFIQKFSQKNKPDLICRICAPEDLK